MDCNICFAILPWFIFHGLEKDLITVMILFQQKVVETTHLSNSQNIGCRSDYVCDEFGDDETDEDGADAGDKLSNSDVYKTEEDKCDEGTMSESDDDHQECPRNELQYVYSLRFLQTDPCIAKVMTGADVLCTRFLVEFKTASHYSFVKTLFLQC